MILSLLILGVCFSNGVLSQKLSPCKISDMTCFEKSINTFIPQIYAGDPKRGIKSSDPLHMDRLDADLKVIRYIFTDFTFTGGKESYIRNLNVDESVTRARFDVVYPNPRLFGNYKVVGELFKTPLNSSGEFSFIAGRFVISVDSALEKTKRENGKTYISVQDFKVKCNQEESVNFHFKNLVENEKLDALHKVINKNWKEVTELLQDPIWTETMKETFNNINEYLKDMPLEDLILN